MYTLLLNTFGVYFWISVKMEDGITEKEIQRKTRLHERE